MCEVHLISDPNTAISSLVTSIETVQALQGANPKHNVQLNETDRLRQIAGTAATVSHGPCPGF